MPHTKTNSTKSLSGRLLAVVRLCYPMEVTKMRSIKRLAILPAAIAAAGIVTGCSYHKTVDATAPAPIVETVPAPAPVVVVPAPETSSTTTTTTESAPTVVQRQKTTTYIAAPY